MRKKSFERELTELAATAWLNAPVGEELVRVVRRIVREVRRRDAIKRKGKHSEKWWAVKIGEEPKNKPYFKMCANGMAPELFTKDWAVLSKEHFGKPVRVEVREL